MQLFALVTTQDAVNPDGSQVCGPSTTPPDPPPPRRRSTEALTVTAYMHPTRLNELAALESVLNVREALRPQ